MQQSAGMRQCTDDDEFSSPCHISKGGMRSGGRKGEARQLTGFGFRVNPNGCPLKVLVMHEVPDVARCAVRCSGLMREVIRTATEMRGPGASRLRYEEQGEGLNQRRQ
jgi:hypothetical protein